MILWDRFIELFQVLIFIIFLYLKPTHESGLVRDANMIKCIETERQALLKFREHLVDDHGQLSSWGMSKEHTQDCCRWKGVQCHNRTGHVLALDLHNLDIPFEQTLRGKISPSLLELQDLTYLDLSYNNFEENHIPEFIGSLSKLQYLSLAGSSFVGEIPQHLGNLTNLRFLDLSFNYLYVINLDWLSHLRMLRHLDLSFVDIGNINWLQPVNKLSSLSELHLSMSGLPGVNSPSDFLTNSSSMSNLAIVDLSNNDYIFSSEYTWLFNLSTSLVHIDKSSNGLQGSIPDTFGNMISLANLNLAANELDGQQGSKRR